MRGLLLAATVLAGCSGGGGLSGGACAERAPCVTHADCAGTGTKAQVCVDGNCYAAIAAYCDSDCDCAASMGVTCQPPLGGSQPICFVVER